MATRRTAIRRLFAVIALLITSGAHAGDTALRLEIKGAIGPATSDYIVKGIQKAADTGAALVIIEMDTPGGLDSAMRDMIKAILNSSVPVATFVSPSGSRAASAGTYLLYASHIAAMAPATNLGAATPVQIGGGQPANPFATKPDDESPEGVDGDKPAKVADPADGKTAMERKSINDAVAYIRGLAELRGRNADWAEQAVRSAESLSATQALEQNVIDIMAESVADLLAAIDGRTVKVRDEDLILATANLIVEYFEPDWRTRLLATITDPNIAYLLMLIGIYGLLFEGYNPEVLPVNYAGLALIILGVILIIAESLVPSFGALGFGGVAAFVFGSIILFDSDIPGMQIARSLIFGIALTASLLLLLLVYVLMKIRRRPAVSGVDSMLGQLAEALDDFERDGVVFINGERWNAHSEAPVNKGDKVRVTKIHGLVVDVASTEQ